MNKMKKTMYQSPSMVRMEVKTFYNILDGSNNHVDDNGNVVVPGNGEGSGDDPWEGAVTKQRNDLWNQTTNADHGLW